MSRSGDFWKNVGEVGDFMFIGEFNCKIDNKGRITLPIKFREQLETTFVITRGLDNCIDLYPLARWEEELKKLQNIKVTDKNQRTYARFLLSAATEVQVDSQGRINIPQSLLTYSKIDKELIVIGNNDKIEIWSKSLWEEFINNSLENIDDIVANIDL